MLLLLMFYGGLALAAGNNKIGENDNKLFLSKVTDNVYAIVGPLGNRSPDNYGNNATFGFVVTDNGVVLVDPGGSFKGAKRIHEVIKKVTSKSIKYVINTGGQDHRWLGNDYFKKLGAQVISSNDAVKDQKERKTDIVNALINSAGEEAAKGTIEQHADITFDKHYQLTLGDTVLDIHHPAGAHSPGDSFVWLPKQKVIFSGDIIYNGRILSLMSFSNSKSWVESYEALAAFKPKYIIPGHGQPTTLSVANKNTYGYLKTLRLKVTEFIEKGGVIEDVGKLDQSKYSYLENYDLLKGRNIQQIYQELEWE